MSPWKPKFKLAGKIFAMLRKRPNIDGEETGRLNANGLAGHDHPDHPRTSTSLTPGLVPTAGHPDLQSDASSNLDVRTSLADDSVHHADFPQRYEIPCSNWR